MTTPTPLSTEDYRNKKLFEGFRDFIARGNMIDMAVGVVMGNAVTAIVKSLVKNLLNPLIAMIFGKPDMGSLLQIHANNATISFGAILNDILNFLLIAAVVYFCVIVPINKFRDLTDKAKKSTFVDKMKFWKHARKGSLLDKAATQEQKIAKEMGFSPVSESSSSPAGPQQDEMTKDDGTHNAGSAMEPALATSLRTNEKTQRQILAALGKITDELQEIKGTSLH